MSGENTTSLGNGFTNLMVILFIARENNFKEVRAIFEGDDCLMSYVGKKIDMNIYNQLGFVVKPDYYQFFNTASFCGQVFDLDTFTVIADPMKYIMNLAWVSMRYSHCPDYIKRGLLRSRALSLLYQYPGCPIIQAMSLCYLRLTEGYRAVIEKLDLYHMDIQRLALQGNLPCREVAFSTRVLMNDVFKINIRDQLLIELYFEQLREICPIRNWVIDKYVTEEQRIYNSKYVQDFFFNNFVPQ
jgi:hypothetical protein